MVLRARSFRDVCFVSDSVTEPRPGAVIKYNDRQSKNGCLVTKVSFPGSHPPMYVSLGMRQLKVCCFPSFEPRMFILDFIWKNAEMYKINQKPGLRFLFA